ncbi:MAG: hypothetical protein J6B77_01300 [Clostridia bacterium]|nr:hypothetical protein [Clostridia bacterium]
METERNEKRLCIGAADALRLRTVFPVFSGEDHANAADSYKAFFSFYREITDAAIRYAEETLFCEIQAIYKGLSEHDRKFCPPRYVYTVEVHATYEGELLSSGLSVTLKKGGKLLFSENVHHLWGMRDGGFALLPPPKPKKRQKARKK